MTDVSVIEYRRRRAERLAKRGYNIKKNEYRTKDGEKVQEEEKDVRMDEPDDDESNGGGGHGNTKIPFGLCQREGIEIQNGWTPKDAWKALEGEGYSASETYKELKETGKVPKKEEEKKKSFEDLQAEMAELKEKWKQEDDELEEKKRDVMEKAKKLNTVRKILSNGDYHDETREEVQNKLTEAIENDSNEKFKYGAMLKCMDLLGEDVFKKNPDDVAKELEKEADDVFMPVSRYERNEKITEIKDSMAKLAKEKYKRISDCNSAQTLESRMMGDDFYAIGEWTKTQIDYSKMSDEAAIGLAKGLELMKKKFPNLQNRLPPPLMKEMEYKTYAAASYSVFSGEVLVNSRWFGGDFGECVKSMKQDVKSDFHPKGTGTVAGIITHEYGHIIDGILTDTFSKETGGKRFSTYLMERIQKNHSGESPMQIMSQVSTYSWKNSSPENMEFLAEAFSEYVCSPKPRPMAKEVGSIMEEFINRLGEKK